jgi:hypothetical protein
MNVLELAETLGTPPEPVIEAGKSLGLPLVDGTSDVPDEREDEVIRRMAEQAVDRALTGPRLGKWDVAVGSDTSDSLP